MIWTLNDRVITRLLTGLDALIVTDWDVTSWEGIPEITPVGRLIDRPLGRDPETIVNE